MVAELAGQRLHRVEDPRALRRRDLVGRQAVPAARQLVGPARRQLAPGTGGCRILGGRRGARRLALGAALVSGHRASQTHDTPPGLGGEGAAAGADQAATRSGACTGSLATSAARSLPMKGASTTNTAVGAIS